MELRNSPEVGGQPGQPWATSFHAKSGPLEHAKKEEIEMMDKCPHDKRSNKELDLRIQTEG